MKSGVSHVELTTKTCCASRKASVDGAFVSALARMANVAGSSWATPDSDVAYNAPSGAARSMTLNESATCTPCHPVALPSIEVPSALTRDARSTHISFHRTSYSEPFQTTFAPVYDFVVAAMASSRVVIPPVSGPKRTLRRIAPAGAVGSTQTTRKCEPALATA